MSGGQRIAVTRCREWDHCSGGECCGGGGVMML